MRIPAIKAEAKLATEIGRFNAALVKYLAALKLEVGKTVAMVAYKVEAMMKVRCPVDTGRLRASIHVTLFGASVAFTYTDSAGRSFDGSFSSGPETPTLALVGTVVEYALVIEAGHSAKAPAGFARVSLETLRPALLAAVKAELAKPRRLS